MKRMRDAPYYVASEAFTKKKISPKKLFFPSFLPVRVRERVTALLYDDVELAGSHTR